MLYILQFFWYIFKFWYPQFLITNIFCQKTLWRRKCWQSDCRPAMVIASGIAILCIGHIYLCMTEYVHIIMDGSHSAVDIVGFFASILSCLYWYLCMMLVSEWEGFLWYFVSKRLCHLCLLWAFPKWLLVHACIGRRFNIFCHVPIGWEKLCGVLAPTLVLCVYF